MFDPPVSPQAAADVYSGGFDGTCVHVPMCPTVLSFLGRQFHIAFRSMCPSLFTRYAGKLQSVDGDTLREAQHISKFAVAAYGLQVAVWSEGE